MLPAERARIDADVTIWGVATDITPTASQPQTQAAVDPPVIAPFPCGLRSLLDLVVHAGVCWIPTDVETPDTLGLDKGNRALLVMTVRKDRPESLDLTVSPVKAQLATVSLHLFSYSTTDDILDEPGSLNGKRSISHKIKERGRTELARAQITSGTTLSPLQDDGFTLTSNSAEEASAEDGLLSVRFSGRHLNQEWPLQLKTVIAEQRSVLMLCDPEPPILMPFTAFSASQDGQHSEQGSDTTPVVTLQGKYANGRKAKVRTDPLRSSGAQAIRPDISSSLSRRNSVPSRPKQRSETFSEGGGVPMASMTAASSWQPKHPDRAQRRSVSSIESPTLPSIDKARRQPSILQQARAEMRAGRSVTPIQPRFANPTLETTGPTMTKLRPTIVIPGSQSGPPAQVLPAPATRPVLGSHLDLPPISYATNGRGDLPANRLSDDSNLASSIGVIPAGGTISPGVLHYIDPANGRTYEIPPGMLEAFLIGTKMAGSAVSTLNPGSGEDTTMSASYTELRPSDTRQRSAAQMAYDASTLPTPPSSTKMRAAQRFEDTVPELQGRLPASTQYHARQESLTMSTTSMSTQTLPTPSPSTVTSDLADDARSMGTFGTPSSTAGSSMQYSTESKRRERRGNLRDRMRQMKSQHQAAGKTLDISACELSIC